MGGLYTVIINKPHLVTRLDIWQPKYSAEAEYGEPVALLHKQKVDFATPKIIVSFVRAKHLAGQRFAITKLDAQRHEVGTNGKSKMYIIPMSHFESWSSGSEILEVVDKLF